MCKKKRPPKRPIVEVYDDWHKANTVREMLVVHRELKREHNDGLCFENFLPYLEIPAMLVSSVIAAAATSIIVGLFIR